MSKKYKGKSEVVNAYKKELSRVKKLTKSMEKRGYILPENVIPQVPKKITEASVRKLKTITPEKLYEKSEFISEETGEIFSGKVARGFERILSAQKGNITKGFIPDYVSILEDFGYEEVEEDIPWERDRTHDLDVIERVRKRLEAIPSIVITRWEIIDMRDEWQEMMEVFESRIASYNGEYTDELINYLDSICGELDRIKVDLLQPSETRRDVEITFARLLEIVYAIPLPREQAEFTGGLTDYTGNWNPVE